MKSDMWTRPDENRRAFIGGSDARIIMGNDEAALVRLWREKRGEAEPDDLSGKLIVQLGAATEELNRGWYERNTGRRVRDVQRRVKLWREFELARPRLLGALLDAASHGLRTLPHVRLDRLPRMADFAIWATACETALLPTGAFARAYEANRTAAIEGVIDADPVAACVREIMAQRSAWTGCAADLLRTEAELAGSNGAARGSSGWPKNPRALAGRLRRVQTALRTLGIEITFGREGRAGTRIIRMSRAPENTVSTDSSVRNNGPRSGQRHPTPRPETGPQERGRC